MYWWQMVRGAINRAKTTTSRTQDGNVRVNGDKFKPLPLSVQREINDIVENEQLIHIKEYFGGSVERIQDCERRSATALPQILNIFNGTESMAKRVADHIGYRDFMTGYGGSGGIQNNMWMSGVKGADPAMSNSVRSNLYISPGEAASVYSNKGLPEIIINKKSKSMLLNGVHIENPHFSQEQLELLEQGMIKSGLAQAASAAVRDALVYGGSVIYPEFNEDTPLSMTLDVNTLIRYGIVGKNCLNRFISLDRWNTTHFPQWNPTAADFRKPRYIYIPFLGCDVHSSRIARIVTSPQPGYWGVMMHMGWGPSDMTGWMEAVFNYMNVMQTIPTMIQQMSIIARTFNVEGALATEGDLVMEQLGNENTMRVREMSVNNPVSLDVVGELKAIQRDFSEVPELMRLVRQDLAAKSGLLEESLFTIEKQGMGGGKDKSAPWTRQEETNRYMYTDIQEQLKPLAMLQVINDLGLSREVIKALPYTTINFDQQKITDIEDRTSLISAVTKGFFDEVAGGMTPPDALSLINQMTGNMLHVSTELMDRLEERQNLNDEREAEQHDIEMEMQAATIEHMDDPPAAGSSAAKPKAVKPKKDSGGGHSYGSRLEQKKHEKVRAGGSKRQGLAKAQAKKV